MDTQNQTCEHLDQIKEGVTAKTDGCEECLQTGDSWVSLRMCLTCGHVGCCDSSKGQHATKHFKETKHAIMESYKANNQFRWCYIDERTV